MHERKNRPPADHVVAQFLNRMNEAQREDFEERAGILEYEAMHPRQLAESLALIDIIRRHPEVLTGVTVFQIVRGGEKHFVLTTDVDSTQRHLTKLGVTDICRVDLAEVVHRQFNGTAQMVTFG